MFRMLLFIRPLHIYVKLFIIPTSVEEQRERARDDSFGGLLTPNSERSAGYRFRPHLHRFSLMASSARSYFDDTSK